MSSQASCSNLAYRCLRRDAFRYLLRKIWECSSFHHLRYQQPYHHLRYLRWLRLNRIVVVCHNQDRSLPIQRDMQRKLARDVFPAARIGCTFSLLAGERRRVSSLQDSCLHEGQASQSYENCRWEVHAVSNIGQGKDIWLCAISSLALRSGGLMKVKERQELHRLL